MSATHNKISVKETAFGQDMLDVPQAIATMKTYLVMMFICTCIDPVFYCPNNRFKEIITALNVHKRIKCRFRFRLALRFPKEGDNLRTGTSVVRAKLPSLV